MKRLFSLLLILLFVFSLASCKPGKEDNDGKKTMKLAIVYTALGDFWDICGSGGKKRVEELKTE